jgi:dihydrofolate reductase
MTNDRQWRGYVFIATSLDGFIARPDGDIDWLTDPPADPGHAPGHEGASPAPDYPTFMSIVDHIVMGRGTYEKVLTFGSWPYPDHRVVVLSTTLTRDRDEHVTVTRDLAETLALLERRGARAVYVDGGKVVQAFLEYDLVDEIMIGRAPVILGEGLPLFGALSHDIRLTHLGTGSSDSGMANSHYLISRPSA